MPVIDFPYGKKFLTADLPDHRYAGSLVSSLHGYKPEKGEWDLVADALAHPVGSPALSELARGKEKIVLLASDHTRPVPSKIIVPFDFCCVL